MPTFKLPKEEGFDEVRREGGKEERGGRKWTSRLQLVFPRSSSQTPLTLLPPPSLPPSLTPLKHSTADPSSSTGPRTNRKRRARTRGRKRGRTRARKAMITTTTTTMRRTRTRTRRGRRRRGGDDRREETPLLRFCLLFIFCLTSLLRGRVLGGGGLAVV